MKEEDIPAESEQEEQELYEHHRIKVEPGQAMIRIDKFLHNRIMNSTRSRIQIAADSGFLLVNGKSVKSSYKVKPNDLITIVLPEPVRIMELIPQDIPLNIIYEDDELLIINKEAGMVVHPAYGHYSGTMMNGLAFHFKNLPSSNSKAEGDIRPGLVHRIDKNTSGLLVIAKNERSMTILAKEFFDRTIKRTYTALVWGDLKNDEGTITGNIGRSLKDRKVMAVFPEGDHGKHAVTHYKVLERFRYVTLIECRLETGRTHQIRVHMQFIGHPIFNDEWYGGDRILKGTTFTKYKQFIENCFVTLPRHALHAKTLGFLHPATKKMLNFDSELPDDFQLLLNKWRKYSLESIAAK